MDAILLRFCFVKRRTSNQKVKPHPNSLAHFGLQIVHEATPYDWMVENAEGCLAIADALLALAGGEAPIPRSFFGSVLSGISKTTPWMSLKTSWKVYDAWIVRQPPT